MATYKVIQDIEAEDKLVGPFSFRQFVYLLVAAFLGYLSFISVAKSAAFLLIFWAPPMLFCMFFAWPWSPDQPTEVWALAHIRFFLKSRKRVWDQSGVKEFVTITVPKKIERHYTDGLSQTEVRSRLNALATTIDSRGWAVKNANLTDVMARQVESDRLVNFSSMPQPVSDIEVRAKDDILDENHNPVASHMAGMIDASTKARRQGLIERLKTAGGGPVEPQQVTKPWFSQSAPGVLPSVVPADPAQQFSVPMPAAPAAYASQPATANPVTQPVEKPVTQPVTQPAKPMSAKAAPATPKQPDAAILNLAHNNNLDVATLAREAQKARELEASDGEVVVSLR